MDERDIIIAARNGEISAYSELVRRHQAKVRAALAVRMKNVHDAEDLAQDAFVIAYRKLQDFDVEREFGPWVRSIAFNLLRNYWRKHRAEPVGSPAELEQLIDQQIEGRHSAANESGKLDALRICIGKLSDDLKLLMYKHYHLGMTVAELTKEAGVKHSAMTMRLHRMRDQLRRCISEQEGSCPL